MSLKIGAAGVAHPHIFSFLNEALKIEGVSICGIAERDESLKEKVKSLYNVPIFNDIDELLKNTEADVIATAAINNEKADIIVKSLRAGKHVVADKPLVTTLEDLDRVENELRNAKNGAKLYLMFGERFTPALVAAKEFIEEGGIGEIVNCISLRPHRLAPEKRPAWMFNRAQYGGIITDLAVHDIDIIRWLTGSEVDSIVSALHSNKRFQQFKDFQDNGEIMLTMSDGSTAFVMVNWLTPDAFPLHGDCRVLVTGTKGQIEAYTLGSKVIISTDSLSPGEIPVKQRDFTFAEDIIKSFVDPGYQPILKLDDMLKATRISLKAQEMAERAER